MNPRRSRPTKKAYRDVTRIGHEKARAATSHFKPYAALVLEILSLTQQSFHYQEVNHLQVDYQTNDHDPDNYPPPGEGRSHFGEASR